MLRNSDGALLATNFYNFETLVGVMQAAVRCKSAIILQLTRSSLDYMGLSQAYRMARTAIEHHGVEAWVHLDHGDSVELVAKCLDEGFDSVMIDASEKPFRENIRITQEVASLASRYGACGPSARRWRARASRGHARETPARIGRIQWLPGLRRLDRSSRPSGLSRLVWAAGGACP